MARPNITVQHAVDEYMELRADLAGSTRRAYVACLGHFARGVGRDLNIRSLSPRHVESYFLTAPLARTKMVGPRTFNKERVIVGTFLSFCASRAWVGQHLMANVRMQKVPQKQRLRLSPKEMMDCLDIQYHPRDRMIIALGLNTALRASEIVSLKIADVDLEQGWLYTTMHKNGKVDTFPINADLDAELRRWLKWYAENVGNLLSHYYLVPARKPAQIRQQEGGRWRADAEGTVGVNPTRSCFNGIRQPIHRALDHLGLPTKGEGLHTLRRSVARAYYDKIASEGEQDPLRVTQQLLNHASALTTESYLGVERERTRRDESLRGKPFLSALITDDNVVPLRKVESGDSLDQGS